MIFISHKQEDTNFAITLSKFLNQHDIETYIDVLDPDIPSIRNDSYKIVDKVTQKLDNCSYLLCLYTKNTEESMWVPFEIGFAYKGDKGIVTFVSDNDVQLPDYLKILPVIHNEENEIHTFINYYNNDTSKSYSSGGRLNGDGYISKSYSGTSTFIRELKKQLNQINW